MSEFIPGICWQEFPTTNQLAVNALNNVGFKALRIFFNLCDLPYTVTPNQTYIKNLFATMPNPLHAWTFEGHASVNTTTEPMRASFDFCKRYSWLPIVCMGYQEELPHNWLGRAPLADKWQWLGKFAYEFALYLKNTMGFSRADLEVWNEPSKCMGWQHYCGLSLPMATEWKRINNYKVHVFADDLLRQDYLNGILTNTALCNKVDYIGTHIGVGSEDDEWDRGLVQITAIKISRYPHLKQALTEMSLNGTWSRLQQLPNNVAMYGIIGAIRNKEFGTATRIDDIFMYGNDGSFIVTSQDKANILTNFNRQYYVPYDIVEDDMIIEKIYKMGSKGLGVKFIQRVLNADIEIEIMKKLVVDGQFGSKTKAVVEEYQRAYDLTVDGMVGLATLKVMVFNEPNLWDEFQLEYATGIR